MLRTQRVIMKWYHSIKVKLLGFFLFMCLVFLITLIMTFFYIEKNQFKENALKETSLATQDVLNYIQKKQINAEVIVTTLASIHENILEYSLTNKKLIPAILDTPLFKDMNLKSAGIWFEPYHGDTTKKDYMIFVDRNDENKFHCTNTYVPPNNMNYRDMTFYKMGKALKDNEITWTNVYTDPVTHIRMITIVSPIYHKSTFIGVASLDLGLGEKDEKFWSNLNAQGMYLMLIDQKGTFIGKSPLFNHFI